MTRHSFEAACDRILGEGRVSDPDSCFVFDIDDTLFRTDSVIRVLDRATGEVVDELTPAEYNEFKERPDSERYDLDFSDFDRLDKSVNPQPIRYTFKILDNIMGNSRRKNVYVLTARRAVVRDDIIARLAEMGIPVKPESVYTIGDASLRRNTTIAQEKARVLRELRRRHSGTVTFFDDDEANLEIARGIRVGGKGIKVRKISGFVR